MRQTGRGGLTDFQRALVLLIVVSGLFMAAMAAGLRERWPLLSAVGLMAFAGLLVAMLRRRYSGWSGIRGTARVIEVSAPPQGRVIGRCNLRVLVDLPNRPVMIMKLRDVAVHVTKWPYIGMELPVEVPRENPRRLRIRWTRVSDAYHRAPAGTPNLIDPYLTDDLIEPPAEDPTPREADLPGLDLPGPAPTPPPPTPAPPPPGPTTPPPGPTPPAPGPTTRPPGPTTRPPGPTPPAPGPTTRPPGPTPPAPEPAPPGAPRPRATRPGGLPVRIVAQRRPEPEAARTKASVDIMLVVSDLAESIRFYRELPGLALIDEEERSALFSYGDGRILLEQRAEMPGLDRRLVHVYIRVADVVAEYRRLREKSATFAHRPKVIKRTDRLELWVATLHDPDGHAIGLAQWRDRRTEAPSG